MAPGPHSVESDGQANLATVFMTADIALASAIRSQISPSQRLATVSMHLQLNGAPVAGTLEARGQFMGFAADAVSRQGLARVTLRAGDHDVGFGHGAFMPLDPPPGTQMFALQPYRMHPVDAPDETTLEESERDILRRADAALAGKSGSFISRFFGLQPARDAKGASCSMPNGAHVGNRVGHAQGGVLMGLAAVTASEALGTGWRLASIGASFVSPGEGGVLEASAAVTHRGRWTAVARTEVIVPRGRRVLEVSTTHARRGE
jgi:acyl-coenzyme A thioesterase PaaI-like protein